MYRSPENSEVSWGTRLRYFLLAMMLIACSSEASPNPDPAIENNNSTADKLQTFPGIEDAPASHLPNPLQTFPGIEDAPANSIFD